MQTEIEIKKMKRWREDDRNGANGEQLRERQTDFSPAAT